MSSQFEVPILLLIFNRPDTTQEVFGEIKKQRPKFLFVAADGPRENRVGEKEKCNQAKNILKQIDWECELKTLFREENLGCGRAVSGAISWFFENVEEGIILEDDCLPHPDFFGYCKELLEKYRDNEQVMFIGSNNFQDGIKRGNSSYYFSAFNHVWGWAAWRSTWEKYNFELKQISENNMLSVLETYFEKKSIRNYWKIVFDLVKRHKIDTWDYQLTFSIWLNKGLSIIPNINLVSNIGFGAESTHTGSANSKFANMKTGSILPLIHPSTVEQYKIADAYYSNMFRPMMFWVDLLFLRLKFLLPKQIVQFLKRLLQN